MKIDLTVAAIPAYLGAMGAEFWWQRRHPVASGTRAGDYQLADTLASLTMGVGSLVVPLLTRRLLRSITPGVGRYGKVFALVGVAATVGATVGDVLRRRLNGRLPDPHVISDQARVAQQELAAARLKAARLNTLEPNSSSRAGVVLTRAHAALAVSAVAATALTGATLWTAATAAEQLFGLTRFDLGEGGAALLAAVFGWDFIYYFNHRLMHESRWLWAVHVVHHSSERYNLSTALRQPVAEGFTIAVPYGLLALLGVRPSLIEQARAINLIYQFWIHTEVIRRVGWLETIFNTPSHHRVHHGSNSRYLDRNHGSILIIWDKLFGTFEEEREPVVYGLTTNIDTYNPLRVATHEVLDIARDIARQRTWRARWSFLLRGPGWASAHRSAPVPAA